MYKNKGFSLIELLLVLAILIVVFSFSTPLALRLYRSQLLEENRNNIIDTLQRAKHRSILQKNDSNFGVKISDSLHNIVLFQGVSYEQREENLDEIYDLLPDIVIDGLTEIVFSKLTGVPNWTGTTSLTLSSLTSSFLISETGNISK